VLNDESEVTLDVFSEPHRCRVPRFRPHPLSESSDSLVDAGRSRLTGSNRGPSGGQPPRPKHSRRGLSQTFANPTARGRSLFGRRLNDGHCSPLRGRNGVSRKAPLARPSDPGASPSALSTRDDHGAGRRSRRGARSARVRF
jgi:hypothetical protein